MDLSALMPSFLQHVSLQEKILFTRHLSIMVKAGMSILTALQMLQKQTKSHKLAYILERVAKDVDNGQFLAASLAKFENTFGNLFINIIRVGEVSGNLSENLAYLSEELKKKGELRRKVIGALIYPMVILGATLGITGMLTIFIFPKILPIFASLNVDLPPTTKFLILVSNFMTQRGWLVLSIFLALSAGIFFLLRIKKVKFITHRLVIYIPVLGKMAQDVNMANFSRTLGMLLKSGVKIVEATNITADTLGNLVYQKELREVATSIQRGETISKQLGKNPRLFPAMSSNMIAVGESTGNLSDTLIYLSSFYESEVDETTKNLTNVLEPLLMVVMGLLVGFVAISIITPIYQVTQNIGR